MELKYIPKNAGYIIGRKIANLTEDEEARVHRTKGTMYMCEVLPADNQVLEKEIAEYAFDSMKENILNKVRKKYRVSNDEIINYYFEGEIQKNENDNIHIKFKDAEIPVNEANFQLKFEVALKVKARNFLKVQYSRAKDI